MYTVGNARLALHSRVVLNLVFRPYIRLYVISPNENYKYSYDHSNARLLFCLNCMERRYQRFWGPGEGGIYFRVTGEQSQYLREQGKVQ